MKQWMSTPPLFKRKKFILLLCFLSIGIIGAVYFQPITSIISPESRDDVNVPDKALSKVTDDATMKATKPNLSEIESTVDLATVIKKDKLDRIEKKATIKQLEQEVKELDEIAEKSIELLYKKTGTTKEEMKKRFAAALEQQ